ncbi:DDE superfamily endonuclease [Popillia japonica]|uniref:DDE superfamily endonuclease n=1 Tax=Popillia japonica TaxID=7064 RepID=A0AAW1M9E3_POPJA
MGLAKATVHTIRDRKEEIKAHSFSATPLSISKSTRQRSIIMEEMEKLLNMWIEDNKKMQYFKEAKPMDQGAIATFKTYYLRRTFLKLISETDDESSIKHFWKNYSIRYAVDNISESWKELQPTIMNNVWKTIWPEYIKTNEPQVSSLSEIRQNILKLANNVGFEDLE